MSRVFAAGSSEHATYDGTPPVTAAPFTVSLWARCTDSGSSIFRRAFGLGDKDVTNQQWSINFRNFGGRSVQFTVQTASGEVTSQTGAWSPNQWHHAAGVEASSTSHTAYLDGVAATTNTTSRAPSGADRISIGKPAESSPASSEYFTGDIAEVGIWDVDLTAAEILSLSKGVTPPNIRPGNLVFYAPLVRDDSAGRDLVGGLSLTYTGTSASAHPRVFRKNPRMRRSFIIPFNTGTIAATLQKATFSGSGAKIYTGTIGASLQKATAAMTGSQAGGTEGTVSATMQKATASLTGAMQPSGTVTATMRKATFSGSATQTQTGTITAALQKATASLSGAQVYTGTIAAALQKAVFSGAGAQIYTGTVAATMQKPTAALVGVMQPSGVIAVTMRKATFSGAGLHQQTGALAAALQKATFSGAGKQIYTGTMAGTLRYLTFEGIGVLAKPGFAIVLDSYADGMRLLDQYADGITLTDAYADGMKLFDLAADGITVDDDYSNGARIYDGRQ